MTALDQLKDSLWVMYALVRGIISMYTPIPDIHYDDVGSVHLDDTEG